MRKRIVFIIGLCFSVLCCTINSKAEILSDGDTNICGVPSFNILRGVSPEAGSDYGFINELLGSSIKNGTYYQTMVIKGEKEEHTIKECFYFQNGDIVLYEEKFDMETFFELKWDTSNDHIDILVDKEVELYEIAKDCDTLFSFESKSYGITGTIEEDDTSIEDFYDHHYFEYLVAGIVKVNPIYKNQDVHIVMSYSKMYTMAEIEEAITVSDPTSKVSYRIDQNTYPEDAEIGRYSFRIIAEDVYGHITVQKVYVDVVDVIRPTIKQKKTVVTSYRNCLTDESLKEFFTYYDYSTYQVSYDIEEYLKSYSVCQSYDAKVTVTDKYKNSTEYSFEIFVQDDVAPKLVTPQTIYVDSSTFYDDAALKNRMTAIDEIDGNLRDSIKIIDLNQYKENYQTPGVYQMQAYVEDKSGNPITQDFTIVVRDEDYPEISIDSYIITTKKGETLKKEEIIALFQSLGIDIDSDSLEGEAFELNSLDGEYEIIIHKENGDIEIVKISTSPVDIEYPSVIAPKESKKVDTTMILVISITTCCILAICGSLGIVLYRKKH